MLLFFTWFPRVPTKKWLLQKTKHLKTKWDFLKISFLGNVTDKRNIVFAFFRIKRRRRFTCNSEQLFSNRRVNRKHGYFWLPVIGSQEDASEDPNEHFPVISNDIKDVFVFRTIVFVFFYNAKYFYVNKFLFMQKWFLVPDAVSHVFFSCCHLNFCQSLTSSYIFCNSSENNIFIITENG